MKQAMTAAGSETIEREMRALHEWRVSQLERFGIPRSLAEIYADDIDWHQVARLVTHGCPPLLALRIVR